MIEGVRFRMDHATAILDRGAIFGAARHALALWRWFARPDAGQTQAIEQAAAGLSESGHSAPRSVYAPGLTATATARRCAPRWRFIGNVAD